MGKERIARTKKRYRGLDERKINQCHLAHEWMIDDVFLCFFQNASDLELWFEGSSTYVEVIPRVMHRNQLRCTVSFPIYTGLLEKLCLQRDWEIFSKFLKTIIYHES